MDEELQNKKLQLEIEQLQSKQGLEKEKLRREIEELSQAPLRSRRLFILTAVAAGLSALTSLTVAMVGGFISLQIQKYADRQHDSEQYQKLLQDLGTK